MIATPGMQGSQGNSRRIEDNNLSLRIGERLCSRFFFLLFKFHQETIMMISAPGIGWIRYIGMYPKQVVMRGGICTSEACCSCWCDGPKRKRGSVAGSNALALRYLGDAGRLRRGWRTAGRSRKAGSLGGDRNRDSSTRKAFIIMRPSRFWLSSFERNTSAATSGFSRRKSRKRDISS